MAGAQAGTLAEMLARLQAQEGALAKLLEERLDKVAKSVNDTLEKAAAAQGTSLVALVPPTGLLAFINYAQAGQVRWIVGLLIMPGVVLGSVYGSRLAQKLAPSRMRRLFACLLFLLGLWQVISVWFARRV